jgi:hypothetical protein
VKYSVLLLQLTKTGLFGNEFIKQRITRERWQEIKNNLHPDVDSLMQSFRRQNKKYYYPTEEVSVDETLFLYKGSVRFRQRMPMKPQSTGLKYFVIADKNGFIWDAFLYKGSETKEVKMSKEDASKQTREEGQTTKIVNYFMSGLKKRGHKFYMDMYYGGEKVMDALIKKHHGGVVACQANQPSNVFTDCLHHCKC